ncbi:MAG TPA: carboxypeptidase-like regulatory domain-containing protein, partial [Puia sp.]|nr:carboxypeptidase-like regulatory domain-containing protein [Puia sp.]
MRKLITLIVCMSLAYYQASAQDHTIIGKITDATGAPLEGAVIKVSGSSSTTTSSSDGSFRLKAPVRFKNLVVSYVGAENQTVPISESGMVVVLKNANKVLSEVIVVGYGTKLKKDVTGSVATVAAKEISNTPATSFESAIQGRAAGVLVTQQNGKLGQGINIRIRGSSSVTAGNEP